MLKGIVIGILALSIIFITGGFLLPDKITLTQSIKIKAPTNYVFEEVNELERWADWSYMQKHDPSMEITYVGRKSGRMAGYRWKNNNGDGSLRLTESLPDTALHVEVLPNESDTAFVNYKLKHHRDTTELVVTFKQNNFRNLFKRWKALLFVKGEIDQVLKYELGKIREIAEAKPIFTKKITEESLAPTYFISIKGKINSKSAELVFAEKKKMFSELKSVFKKSNAEIVGPPFCIYPDNIVDSGDVTYAMPISPDSKFPSSYPVAQHYSGAAIKGVHLGAFDSLSKTHDEVKQYIDYKNFRMNGAPWEVFVKGSDTEYDASKWVTEVYYPVN
ncbi:MAG TPA: hypothetical protein VFW11_07700 [Cyclobacteriaceae bacterium]|nr:hypothetical protein [Cyclobacteriaceae bacterium]